MNVINEIEKKEIWDIFVKKQKFINILSSWEWIEFEKFLGFDTCAYSILDKGVFAFRTVNSKKGKYLILKQNTFLDWEDKDLVKIFLDFLITKCKEKHCSFFRLSPTILYRQEVQQFFENYSFKKSIISATEGQLSIILNLTENLEKILSNMRKNTRYLIKKGEKMGVEILSTGDCEFLSDFERIYIETQKRNKWNGFDFVHIAKQYAFFSQKGISRMFVAKYQDQVLATAIFTKYGNQVIYHHSGSVKNDIPAMYALMWEAIKYYKDLGLTEFNFFGVCQKEDFKHPWYGLSLFKRGFGGIERKLMHSFDYPVNLKYFFFRVLELACK